ncbi:MAG: hypothetical protein ACK4MQ_04915 [Hyphomonas sp.]
MRVLDYLLGGLALLALPFIMWWGIYQSTQSAVNLEARLEAHAKAALAKDGFDWADVKMDGQRALLTGAAPSADAVIDAAAAVRRSSWPGGLVFGGVTIVENRADAAPPISPYVWRATKTEEGRFILEGYVPAKATRLRLVEEARLAGRSAVDDQMKLAPGAPAGNFQGIARLAINQLAKLETGEVTISDYRVTLRGETPDPAIRAEVAAAIGGIAAPYRGEPLVAGNVLWRASLTDTGLSLTGNVLGEAERRQILALVAAHFDGPVEDAMVLGPDLPDGWLSGALAGLPQFLTFEQGDMAFDASGGVFLIDGEARGSTAHFLRRDMARMAAPWRSVVAVSLVRPDVSRNVPEEPGLVSAMSAGDPAAGCDDAVEAALASGGLAFAPGSGMLSRDSGPALDQLAAALQSCEPSRRIEIEAPGAAHASDLADFLVSTGIPRARLAAISYGGQGEEAANQAAEAGGADAKPIRIRVLERSGE